MTDLGQRARAPQERARRGPPPPRCRSRSSDRRRRARRPAPNDDSPTPPDRHRWRCRRACRGARSRRRGEQIGPLLREVGRPEEPARLVVDCTGEPDHGMRGCAVATLRGHGGDEVDQRRGNVSLRWGGDGSTQQNRPSGSTRAARIWVPPTSAARTGRHVTPESSWPPVSLAVPGRTRTELGEVAQRRRRCPWPADRRTRSRPEVTHVTFVGLRTLPPS